MNTIGVIFHNTNKFVSDPIAKNVKNESTINTRFIIRS